MNIHYKITIFTIQVLSIELTDQSNKLWSYINPLFKLRLSTDGGDTFAELCFIYPSKQRRVLNYHIMLKITAILKLSHFLLFRAYVYELTGPAQR